jgi:hypothetical protein
VREHGELRGDAGDDGRGGVCGDGGGGEGRGDAEESGVGVARVGGCVGAAWRVISVESGRAWRGW